MDVVVYLITGLLAGVVGGLLGTGGCALMMPVVRFGFHFDPAFAVGTTLTAVVFTAASGAYQHVKMKNVDRDTALRVGASGILGVIVGSAFKFYQQVVNVPVAVTLGIGAAVGAIFGAKLVAKFKPNVLKALFGVLFLYVSLKYILIFFGVHI